MEVSVKEINKLQDVNVLTANALTVHAVKEKQLVLPVILKNALNALTVNVLTANVILAHVLIANVMAQKALIANVSTVNAVSLKLHLAQAVSIANVSNVNVFQKLKNANVEIASVETANVEK